jgi:hypothetical protein
LRLRGCLGCVCGHYATILIVRPDRFVLQGVGERRNKTICIDPPFNNYISVERLYSYPFRSENEAFVALQELNFPNTVRKTTESVADKGPCALGGQYVPGQHINTRFVGGPKGEYPGSLVQCPCCDDSSGQPVITERWGII